MANKILLKNCTIINNDTSLLTNKDIFITDGKITNIKDNEYKNSSFNDIINNFEDTNDSFEETINNEFNNCVEYNNVLKNSKIESTETCIDDSVNNIDNTNKFNKINNDRKIVLEDTSKKINGDYEVIDCTNYYITPGLVNLHTHAAMSIFKGIAEDVTIDDWFNKEIFPYESKLTEKDVYNGVKLAIAEMINNGVTAFADHYFYEEAVLKAALDMNIRIDLAPTIFGLAPNYKEQLENAKNFIINNRDISKLVNLRLGPHATYTCPENILKEIIDVAKMLDVGIHLHVSETKEQVEDSLNKYGKTPFEIIDSYGGFDINTIIAHGLWVEENDTKIVQNNNNVHFAFCPKTYMKLAMGEGNIYKFYDRINFSFGTDGGASSNTLNPVEQARLFALNGKMINNNSTLFNIKFIWNHLMSGHNALSFNTGKIQEDYEADLVIWDLNKFNTFPIYNPVTSIIYSSNQDNIWGTMVNGKFLKKDGKLQFNSNNIMNDVINIKDNLVNRGKGKSNVNY